MGGTDALQALVDEVQTLGRSAGGILEEVGLFVPRYPFSAFGAGLRSARKRLRGKLTKASCYLTHQSVNSLQPRASGAVDPTEFNLSGILLPRK
jgi:hypothetical protein